MPKTEAAAGNVELMTFAEACEHAHIGKTTTFKLIRDGKIVARKLGRRTLIERRSLDRFLNSLPRKAVP